MAFDRTEYSKSTGSVGSLGLKSSSALTTNFSGPLSDNLAKSGLSTSTISSIGNESLKNLSKFDASNLDLSGSYSMAAAKNAFMNRLGSSSSSEPVQKVFNSQKSNKNSGGDKYPADLGEERMIVEFMEYKRPDPMSQATTSTVYECALPVPVGLVETFSMRINPQDTGILGAAVNQGMSIARESGALEGKTPSKDELLSDSIGMGYQGIATVGGAFGQTGEQVVGTVGQLAGAIPNPHISVFFNGINTREIEFSWLFSPRSKQEASSIKNIIKQFKAKTLPPVSASTQNIMGYPHMVKLTLSPWNGDGMPSYKKGLIRDLNINYTPNNKLSLFDDNHPVFITLSFTFVELEVWTAQDIDKDAKPAGAEGVEFAKKLANSARDAVIPST